MRRFLLVALVAACGDDSDATSVGPDRDIASRTDTGTRDAPVARDLGNDSTEDIASVDLSFVDTGDDTADGPPVETTQVGLVAAFEVRAPGIGDLETGGLGAGFDLLRAEPGIPPVDEIGPCVIRHTSESQDLFESGPSFDAGQIDVSIADTDYTLSYVGDRYESSAPSEQIEFFEVGDTIRFDAAGGLEVDTFSISLTAPGDPEITSPVWGAFEGHDRSAPLTVTWSGTAGTGAVVNVLPVEIFPDPGVADGYAITCTVDDSGSLTIPVEALAYLPEAEGIGGGSVALTVVRIVNSTLVVGETEVTGNATASHTIVGTIE